MKKFEKLEFINYIGGLHVNDSLLCVVLQDECKVPHQISCRKSSEREPFDGGESEGNVDPGLGDLEAVLGVLSRAS